MSIRDALVKKQRPNRVPVAESRNVLTVEGNIDRNAFVPRWVNDVDDRIARFVNAGYEFVKNDGITVGDTTVDFNRQTDTSIVRKGVGGGKVAYLMAIPKEFYDEDQAKKQAKLDELEDTMLQAVNAENSYGKVTIQGRNNQTRTAEKKAPKS